MSDPARSSTSLGFAPDRLKPQSEAPQRTLYAFTSKEAAEARKVYLKILFGGTLTTVILIFAVFSIFWASLYKTPTRNLPGWIVNFDDGEVGQSVLAGFNSAPQSQSKVSWTVLPASDFPNGPGDVARAVHEHTTWVAVSVNPGASSRLASSLSSPNSSYNGQDAMTVFASEGRNENAFRSLIRPSAQATLDAISRTIALQVAARVASLPNAVSLLQTSPQTVISPVSYTIRNLAPFDQTLATAVTFIGLLYQLILSFFIVMIGNAAREQSGLAKNLTTKSLILTRFATAFTAFGRSGFLVFWMLNYAGMLACGLALESLITLLTTSGIPFFMLTWIITNVSVCIFPIEVMPSVFRYGYAFPFYNTSVAIRTVLFGTKNRVGFSFGIVIIWIAISCLTLPLIQWFVRRTKEPSAPKDTSEDLNESESKTQLGP